MYEKVSQLISRATHPAARRRTRNIHITHKWYKKFSRTTRVLGPGVVTGAADDDPSGIATYSQAGAAYGFGLLWLFPVMFPLLLAVQESCARIGAVTASGLAAILKRHYSKKLLYASVFLVVVANIVNIGADLAAMAAAAQLFLPSLDILTLAIGFALITIVLQITIPYRQYAKILKWLAISLFAYPITALLVGFDWSTVIHHTFVPQFVFDEPIIYIMVGILGTTISPYLFFWNTSEVVENEVATKRIVASSGSGTPRLSRRFMRSIKLDNFAGMSLASITAWFIVVACASVLHSHGVTNIETAADAAKALEPLVQGFPHAGLVAKIIFSVGIIGVGLLAVPVLAGSSSYAISEALGLKEGLYRSFHKAHGFYCIIILAIIAGLGFNLLGIDPIKALLFAAVFNAISTVPLLWMIYRIGNNPTIMGEYRNGHLSNIGVIAAFVVMLIATVVLFISFIPR